METADEETLDLDCYNWCKSDDGDIWYHIVKFWVSDSSDKIVPLHETLQVFQRNSPLKTPKKLTLYGEIIPINTSYADKKGRMGIRTEIVDYELNFGKSVTDVGRGLWFKDANDAWYKLEPPFSPEYELFITQTLKNAPAYNLSSQPFVMRQLQNVSVTKEDEKMHSLILGDKDTYIVRGSLIPRSDSLDRPTLNVKVFVNMYSAHLGSSSKPGEKDRSEFWVRDIEEENWYKLQSFSPQYQPRADVSLQNTLHDMSRYNWATKPQNEVWRHIREYVIRNSKGEMIEPDQIAAPAATSSSVGSVVEGAYILAGVLVPSEGAHSPRIAVNVYLSSHAIDFGLSKADPQRGLWVCDIHGNWYKLEEPYHPSYAMQAKSALKRCAQFLKLYDALVYRDTTTSSDLEGTGMKCCTKTIQAVHKESSGSFDLDFVRVNKTYVLRHLAATFDPKRSASLLKSISDLGQSVGGGKSGATQEVMVIEEEEEEAPRKRGVVVTKPIAKAKKGVIDSDGSDSDTPMVRKVDKKRRGTVPAPTGSKPIGKKPRLDEEPEVRTAVPATPAPGPVRAPVLAADPKTPLWPSRAPRGSDTVPPATTTSQPTVHVENTAHRMPPQPVEAPPSNYSQPVPPPSFVPPPLQWVGGHQSGHHQGGLPPPAYGYPQHHQQGYYPQPPPVPTYPPHHEYYPSNQYTQQPMHVPGPPPPYLPPPPPQQDYQRSGLGQPLGYQQEYSGNQNMQHGARGPPPPQVSNWNRESPVVAAPAPVMQSVESTKWMRNSQGILQQEKSPPPLREPVNVPALVPLVDVQTASAKFDQWARSQTWRAATFDSADGAKAAARAREKEFKCIHPDCFNPVDDMKCGRCSVQFQLQPSFCDVHCRHGDHIVFMNQAMGIEDTSPPVVVPKSSSPLNPKKDYVFNESLERKSEDRPKPGRGRSSPTRSDRRRSRTPSPKRNQERDRVRRNESSPPASRSDLRDDRRTGSVDAFGRKNRSDRHDDRNDSRRDSSRNDSHRDARTDGRSDGRNDDRYADNSAVRNDMHRDDHRDGRGDDRSDPRNVRFDDRRNDRNDNRSVGRRNERDEKPVKDEPGPVKRFMPAPTNFQSDRHKEETERKRAETEKKHQELMARIGNPQANVMGPVKTASQTPEDHTLLSNRNNPVYHGKEVLSQLGGAAPERTTHHPLTVGYGEQNRRKKVGTGMGFKDDNHIGDRGGVTVYPPDDPPENYRTGGSATRKPTGSDAASWRDDKIDSSASTGGRSQQTTPQPSGRGRDAVKPAWMSNSADPVIESRRGDERGGEDKTARFDDSRRGEREGSRDNKVDDRASRPAVGPPHTAFQTLTAQYTQSSAAPALDGDTKGDQTARGGGMGRGRAATHPAWMTSGDK